MIKNKVLRLRIVFVKVILILVNFSPFNYQLDRKHQTHSNIRLALVDTELKLLLNGEVKNDWDSIQAEIDDLINVTIYYRDNITKEHIPNATVTLLNWNKLNETNNQYYNITIDVKDLELGVTIFTVSAQKENYQPQTVHFLIEVTAKASQLQLFLDGIDKTEDPIYELTIKDFLNITIKYTHNQTGLHISNATVKSMGDYFTFNLTENTELGQYYYNLNTTELGIGDKFFTLIAHAPNYESKTIDIKLTIKRITGIICRADGGDQLEVDIGDDVILNIILKDPLNNTIKGAIVTYTWVYGQGELYDPDNDGIYNVALMNILEGIYEITIIAFFGDDYDFEPYELTMIVITPSRFTLISDASIPDTDGSFILMWNSSIGADNYSVYQHDKYITEINGSLISLANEITNLIFPLSNYTTGTYYFIVIAHNEGRNTLSNCIEIFVSLPLPGLFLLWSNAGNPDVDGEFSLIWSNSSNANYYSIYQYDKYITEINGSLTLLVEEITNLSLFLNNYLDGTYFFIVVAHGDYGDTLSNCIQVNLLRANSSPRIRGYNLLFVLVMLSIIVVLVFKKRIK